METDSRSVAAVGATEDGATCSGTELRVCEMKRVLEMGRIHLETPQGSNADGDMVRRCDLSSAKMAGHRPQETPSIFAMYLKVSKTKY